MKFCEVHKSVHNLNISYRQLLSLALQDVQFALMNVSQKLRELHYHDYFIPIIQTKSLEFVTNTPFTPKLKHI